MLTELRLHDFKSFDDQAVILGPVTMLVGANASGKSNFLDSIRFLQGISLGLPIADVLRGRWDAGRELWPGIRGGITEAVRSGRDSFGIDSTWTIDGMKLWYSIVCSTEPEPAVVQEMLYPGDSQAYLFDTSALSLGNNVGPSPGGSLRAALRVKGKGRSPSLEYSSTRSLLGQIQPHERAHPTVMQGITAIRKALSSSLFLDIMPSRMRDYVPVSVPALGANGENLSAILHRYCQDEEQKRDLIDWISELCAPAIVDIAFTETDLRDVLLALVEKGGTRVSARSMSDGTLRFLGELTALLTSEKGAVLLMEEIENGLHPARVHLLVEILESVTKGGARQVIATTHSPLVLQALSPEALGDTIVFGRHEDQAGTQMKRLAELPSFEDVLARRGIEHLFTTKWLERAL
jgi:predicted ATPase